MKTRSLIVLCCLLLMLALASCRREAPQAQATAAPTLTPTPRSTPLPALPTVAPPGSAENPLQMVIPVSVAGAKLDASAVQAALLEQSGLSVSIVVVDRDADALAAVCAPGALPSVAWLGGLALVSARAQNCGEVILQVQRTVQRQDSTGETVSLIALKKGVATLSGLNDKTICRLSNGDLYTWLIPAVMLRAGGLDTTELATRDVEQLAQIMPALTAGDCDAAGVPSSVLATGGELAADSDQLTVLGESPAFPYGVLVVPPEVPLGARLALTQALTTLAKPGSATAPQLRSLLGQTALLPVGADAFDDLDQFIRQTGLDFTLLGEG